MKRTNENQNHFLHRTAVMLCVMVTFLAFPSKMWAGSKPVMNVESIKGYAWGMEFSGWAYDPDAPGEAVDIVISYYTDSEFQNIIGYTNGPTYEQRDDVNATYNLTGKHGFKETMYVGDLLLPTEGTYYVQIIAKDISGRDEDVVYQSSAIVVGLEAAPKFNGNRLELTSETEALRVGDGCVITGIGGECTCIVIEDGAMVTLDGIDITTDKYDWGKEPVGIKCLGNATIILKKGTTNYLRGGRLYDPNIEVGPKNTTLTIKGYGSLVARSFGHGSCIGTYDGMECGNIVIEGGSFDLETAYESRGEGHSGHAACIGGSGFGGKCGNITITGGDIKAVSHFAAAAIGTGRVGSCGNITITGGNIYAKSTNYEGGAAIGGGLEGNCGNISISGITCVRAVKHSDNVPYCIGPGGTNSTCGTLTLWGQVTAYPVGQAYYYGPTVFAPTDIPYTVKFNANGGTGEMPDQILYSNTPQALSANAFKHEDKHFSHWSTLPNGEGYDYANGESVTNLGNITLYAQWISEEITLTENTGEVTLQNGDMLTGTGGENTHVVISDGSTVTLSDVDIREITSINHWAGINCKGDATIILADGTTNNVKGNSGQFPAIFIPAGKTLTIKGSGSLEANNDGFGAGIGAGLNLDCGNIIITGGTIIASGGSAATGIGGAPGGSCGNITITSGVTSVTASGGWNAPNSIGAGNKYCGAVTIGDRETGSVAMSPYTYEPSETTLYTITFDANGGEGTMGTQTLASNIPQALLPNAFTRTDYIFMGWTTAADGSGHDYSDSQVVMNIGNTTLYAQWSPSNDIAMISSTGYLALNDGQSLSGTGGANTHIVIADGATVTLKGANITDIANDDSHKWAGISCLGDATIILADGTTNSVKGGHEYYPSIHVPVGRTLTIQGNGTLNATSGGRSAGIGGGYGIECGNIIIKGGIINSTARASGAGIGGGNGGYCGDITIMGGIITAEGASSGAGIGAVQEGGDITITDEVISITAKKGDKATCCIGAGHNKGTCGTITIAPSLIDVLSNDNLIRYITTPGWTGTTNVTLSKEGYGTYYNGLFDLVLPTGMKARIVTNNEGNGTLTYQTIADGSTSSKTVPVGTAVMLQAAPAEGLQTIDVGITVPTVDAISQTNLLNGSEKETNTTGGGDGAKYYKLSYNTSGENIGWYWGKEDGAKFKSAANKAWLALPASAGAREFFGLPDFEETSDIKHETLNIKHGDNAWFSDQRSECGVAFTLDGRKLSKKPMQKGIYVKNGKKVVIK